MKLGWGVSPTSAIYKPLDWLLGPETASRRSWLINPTDVIWSVMKETGISFGSIPSGGNKSSGLPVCISRSVNPDLLVTPSHQPRLQRLKETHCRPISGRLRLPRSRLLNVYKPPLQGRRVFRSERLIAKLWMSTRFILSRSRSNPSNVVNPVRTQP